MNGFSTIASVCPPVVQSSCRNVQAKFKLSAQLSSNFSLAASRQEFILTIFTPYLLSYLFESSPTRGVYSAPPAAAATVETERGADESGRRRRRAPREGRQPRWKS